MINTTAWAAIFRHHQSAVEPGEGGASRCGEQSFPDFVFANEPTNGRTLQPQKMWRKTEWTMTMKSQNVLETRGDRYCHYLPL